jgi:hypothetical protein
MALPNVTRHIIATGASVQVKVSTASEEPDTILGLASNVSYTENYALDRVRVIGVLGAVSIDPQDYTLEITIGTFVPSKRKIDTYQSNITKGVLEMLPTHAYISETTKGKAFQSLEFYDKDTGTTLARFIGCMLASAGMTIEGNAYAKANVQLWAIERSV